MAMKKRDDCKAFGKAVQYRLLELEMTQLELSRLTGIHPRYISVITNGIRPGLKHREKIRATLGMPSVRECIERYSEADKSK